MSLRLGYFFFNIESIRKAVECTFGILKLRQQILEYWIHYQNLESIEEFYLACCVLHDIIVEDPETPENQKRGDCYPPIGINVIYICDGSSSENNNRTPNSSNVR